MRNIIESLLNGYDKGKVVKEDAKKGQEYQLAIAQECIERRKEKKEAKPEPPKLYRLNFD